MNPTNSNIFECDICGKPATVNIQSLWVKWDIDKDGNISEEPEILYDFEPGTNIFYCDRCYRKEFLGEKI
jgi:hypothetical protein